MHKDLLLFSLKLFDGFFRCSGFSRTTPCNYYLSFLGIWDLAEHLLEIVRVV